MTLDEDQEEAQRYDKTGRVSRGLHFWKKNPAPVATKPGDSLNL